MCMVERRQAGIGAGESIAVRIGDGEGICTGLVGTGIAGKQRGEIIGAVIDENAFRRLGITNRASVIEDIVSIGSRSRSRHVIRGIRVCSRVEPGALILADRERLCRRRYGVYDRY